MYSVGDQAREHDRVFHATFSAAKQARSRLVKVRPHRAITSLKLTRYLLAQVLFLPVVLCSLLIWLKPWLFYFWRSVIVFWANELQIPLSFSAALNESHAHALGLSSGFSGAPFPSTVTMAVTAIVVVLGFAVSLRMNDALLPLKYPLRIVCAVQFITLMYFWFVPRGFPYDIVRHSEELMNIGYVGMLSMPVMLAVGYYILNQGVVKKLVHTALILSFFIVMVPHQVVVQALILQHMSVLFMPLLYICFGAVFDALVFVALYSWVVSNAPADATL